MFSTQNPTYLHYHHHLLIFIPPNRFHLLCQKVGVELTTVIASRRRQIALKIGVGAKIGVRRGKWGKDRSGGKDRSETTTGKGRSVEDRSGKSGKIKLNSLSLIIDSGANVNLFSNEKLLENITTAPELLNSIKTALDNNFHPTAVGQLTSDLNGIPFLKGPYYLTKSNASNLLSLSQLSKRLCVFMDTNMDDAFYIFDSNNNYLRFDKCSSSRLYRLDLKESDDKGKPEQEYRMSLVTVKGQQEGYSNLECVRAKAMRELQHQLLGPSDADLAHAIEHNIIGDNNFTRKDVANAKHMFGPSQLSHKGKTRKRKNKMIQEDAEWQMPPAILEKMKEVILSIDVMHLNRVPFLIGKSHHISYYHAIPMLKKNADCIKEAIDKMKAEYGRRGGTVVKLLREIAFECMKTKLGLKGVTIVTLDKARHVPVAERAIHGEKIYVGYVEL